MKIRMRFYPNSPIKLGEVEVKSMISPIDQVYWSNNKFHPMIIDKLFAQFEAFAFTRDYIMFGPVNLHYGEIGSDTCFIYCILSAPMIRAEDWDREPRLNDMPYELDHNDYGASCSCPACKYL